jgi:hypothetical protein
MPTVGLDFCRLPTKDTSPKLLEWHPDRGCLSAYLNSIENDSID